MLQVSGSSKVNFPSLNMTNDMGSASSTTGYTPTLSIESIALALKPTALGVLLLANAICLVLTRLA